MRPVEPDYQEQCKKLSEGEKLQKLLPDLTWEKCALLLRRGTRRCHAMARRFLMEGALKGYIANYDEKKLDSDEIRDLAITLSLIEVNDYTYSIIEAPWMLDSMVKGYAPTWRMTKFGHSWHSMEITLTKEEVIKPFSSVGVHIRDTMNREWNITFEVDPWRMTYRQFRRWIPVLRKWQDSALAAVAAATL
jgi:hypothetical protein